MRRRRPEEPRVSAAPPRSAPRPTGPGPSGRGRAGRPTTTRRPPARGRAPPRRRPCPPGSACVRTFDQLGRRVGRLAIDGDPQLLVGGPIRGHGTLLPHLRLGPADPRACGHVRPIPGRGAHRLRDAVLHPRRGLAALKRFHRPPPVGLRRHPARMRLARAQALLPRHRRAPLDAGCVTGRAVTTARFWYPPRAASYGPAQVTIVSRRGPDGAKRSVVFRQRRAGDQPQRGDGEPLDQVLRAHDDPGAALAPAAARRTARGPGCASRCGRRSASTRRGRRAASRRATSRRCGCRPGRRAGRRPSSRPPSTSTLGAARAAVPGSAPPPPPPLVGPGSPGTGTADAACRRGRGWTAGPWRWTGRTRPSGVVVRRRVGAEPAQTPRQPRQRPRRPRRAPGRRVGDATTPYPFACPSSRARPQEAGRPNGVTRTSPASPAEPVPIIGRHERAVRGELAPSARPGPWSRSRGSPTA